jgi:protein-tyrosine-phosphatase
MSAEYFLKQYLKEHHIGDIYVSSVGIIARPEPVHEETIHALKRFRIDVSGHKQRRMTQHIYNHSDIVIAMAENHEAFIKEHFGDNVMLFNDFATHHHTSVRDVEECPQGLSDMGRYIHTVINYIHAHTPRIAKGLMELSS